MEEDEGWVEMSSMPMSTSIYAVQHALWDEPEPERPALPAPIMSAESREEYECRRVLEMAEKLQWRGLSLEPIRSWSGVIIGEGEQAWRDFLASATSNVISLALLALCKSLNPLHPSCIDGDTGLWSVPVEPISRIEERDRTRMVQLAELLEYPRISYWDTNRTLVFGPGEAAWQKYLEYGSFASITCAIAALERRMSGEPDKLRGESEKTKQTLRQQWHDEEDY